MERGKKRPVWFRELHLVLLLVQFIVMLFQSILGNAGISMARLLVQLMSWALRCWVVGDALEDCGAPVLHPSAAPILQTSGFSSADESEFIWLSLCEPREMPKPLLMSQLLLAGLSSDRRRVSVFMLLQLQNKRADGTCAYVRVYCSHLEY